MMIAFASLVLIQTENRRTFAACVYVFFNVIAHDLIFGKYGGLMYFGTGALFDLFAILIISKFALPSKLAFHLTIICLISIVLNIIGWAMWLTYMEPTLYTLGFIALNIYTLICLIQKEPSHGRHKGNNSRISFILSYFNRRNKLNT